MAFVTAIRTDLREEILRILREDITFEVAPGDVNVTIVPKSIVYQKTQAQINRSDYQSNQMTDVPGLLLCNPKSTDFSETDGTNERDVWTYHWLIQLIDVDLWNDLDRQDTWERWIEQIMSAFEFNCLQDTVVLPKGQVKFACATAVRDIDERRWVRDDKFISGIEIRIQVLQPRGIN